MSEAWLRLGIVGAAILVVLVVTLLLRGRARHRAVPIDQAGLSPGVYLFSSSTCADCIPARRMMEDTLGASGFVEIKWEDEPGLFQEMRLDVVPATVVVAGDGSAVLFPGMPERALKTLGP